MHQNGNDYSTEITPLGTLITTKGLPEYRKSLLEDHKSMLEDRKSPQISPGNRKSLSQDHRTPQYTGRTQPNTANQSGKTENYRKSAQITPRRQIGRAHV